MSLPEPFRGEVWDVDFDDFGLHPAVVLSINPLNARLGHVTVIPVTGTAGPKQTHIPLTADAGVTKYEQSYADITAPQPVARSRLLTRRGLLTVGELERLGRQRAVYLARCNHYPGDLVSECSAAFRVIRFPHRRSVQTAHCRPHHPESRP